MNITVIASYDARRYFFSTDHYQKHGLDDTYVPVTYTLPIHVLPRPSLPTGIITNVDELKLVFYDEMVEIPNPNPDYQPKFD